MRRVHQLQWQNPERARYYELKLAVIVCNIIDRRLLFQHPRANNNRRLWSSIGVVRVFAANESYLCCDKY